MHARSNQFGPSQAGTPLRGTFYPDAAGAAPAVPTMLPRILAILAGVMFMRALAKVARHHGGGHGSQRGGRMDRLAQLHRDLHARDEGQAKGNEEVTA